MWNGVDESGTTVPPPVVGPLPPLTIDSSYGLDNPIQTNFNFLDSFKFESNVFVHDNTAMISSLAREEMERARLPPVNYFNPTINYNFYPQAPMMDMDGSSFGSSFISSSVTTTLPSFESYLGGDRPPMSAYLSELKLENAGPGSDPRPGSGSHLFSAIPYPGSTIGATMPDPSRASSPIAGSGSDSGTGSLAWEDPGVDLYDGPGSLNAGSGSVLNPGCAMASGSSLFTTMSFNSVADYIPFAVAGAETAKKRNKRKNPAALDAQHLQRNALKPVKLRAPKKGKKALTNNDWLRQFLANTSFENAAAQEKMLETTNDAEMRVEQVEVVQKKKRGGATNTNRKSAATLRNQLKKQFGLTAPTASSVKKTQANTDIPPPTRIDAYATRGFSLLRPTLFTPLSFLKKSAELPSIPFVAVHLLKKDVDLPQIPFIPVRTLRRTEDMPWTVLLALPRLRTAPAVHKRKSTVPKKVDTLVKEMDGDHAMPLLSPGMVEETLDGIDNDSIIDVEGLSPVDSSSSSSYDDSADDYKPPVVKRRRRCLKKITKTAKDLNNNKKTVEKPEKIQETSKKAPQADKKIKKEIDIRTGLDIIKITAENKDYWLERCEVKETCVIKTNANWWYALGEHRIDAIGLEILFDANF